MHTPSSTYRIQLHKDFTFHDLLGIIDYLHALGVSTIYAAPILKSTQGSAHGYDVTDPHTIDPEIGTIDELREIALKLKQKNMSWLQDIVPNHMAFDSANTRLMDVLERGSASPYYNYFDIDWNHPSPLLKNKLMVPFLGDHLEACVKNGQLKVSFGKSGFEVNYFKTSYPVSSIAYEFLFSLIRSASAKKLLEEWKEFIRGRAFQSNLLTWKKLKTKWINSISSRERETIATIVDRVNGDEQKLLNLFSRQHYVLAHWKQTEKEINYRRFFTVNQLICLRMEDENVFEDYHSFIHTLYTEGLIQGLRIDHIDGLRDPGAYIQKLRSLFGKSCYIIAEKILEAKEAMPSIWDIQGTSGYEFLAYVSQLFTDRRGAKQLLDFYRTLVPELPVYKEIVSSNKQMMLANYMAGEWDNLVNYFVELGLQGNFTEKEIKNALGLIMVSLPVYRIYPDELPLKEDEVKIITKTFKEAKVAAPAHSEVLDYIHSLFDAAQTNISRENVLLFLKRLMQFTGPLTAKGVEDTTFYVYNPLISHDEVGDSPSTLGISIPEFHKRMAARRKTGPLSLNATATHDTKRGEDVRIRLNVLSEIPEAWTSVVQDWMELNKVYTQTEKATRTISINDEYFIYQSIIGGFPEDLTVSEDWINRLQEYLIKVAREAKVNSSWELPNEKYEQAIKEFVANILQKDSEFLKSAMLFIDHILKSARTYALGQTLIKITAPGIPDFYQGCELWDLSYVDPDNRRPVDYGCRKKYLDKIRQKEKEGNEALISYLKANEEAGLMKMFVAWKALNFRNSNSQLLTDGAYIPLKISGGDKVALSFARQFNSDWILVVIPLAQARDDMHALQQAWNNEAVSLEEQMPTHWVNVFTGKSLDVTGHLLLRDLLEEFPVAFLKNKKA